MIKLSSGSVKEIIIDCAFDAGEDQTGAVLAEGIMKTYGFHPKRLEKRKEDIANLLAQLTKEFQPPSKGGGGGWTFLNGCMDKDGHQWGEQMDVEMLLALGIATDQAKILTTKAMSAALPGGVPYFGVLSNG